MRSHVLGTLCCVSLAAFAVGQDLPAGKFHGDVREVLEGTPATAMVPLTIVMQEQAPRGAIAAAAALTDKASRRAAVVALLKDVAADSQGGLLEYLAAREAAGEARSVRRLWVHNVVAAEVTPAVGLAIAARGDVAYVHHDRPRGKEVLATVPAPLAPLAPAPAAGGTPTCGLNLINAPDVWNLGVTGKGVVVGVIDTGLCITHPDIQNQVWTNPCETVNGVDDDNNGFVDDIYGWNFESNNNNISDSFFHGSHVSGTVAGDGTSGTACGVAPDAEIMVLKFWNSFSGEQSVWDCMQYGLDNGADVLTASLGWPHSIGPDRATWRAVCENVIAAGVVVLYASGNEGCSNAPDNVRTPGDVPDVITIGAVDCSDGFSGFSSCGPITWENVAPYFDHPYPPGLIKPDVSADGVGTVSHNFCAGYTTASGTSMATPHVAGVAALLLEADPTLDHFGVKALLEGTSVDLGAAGKDNVYGTGRVDALAAVQDALTNGNFCVPKTNSCGTTPLIGTIGVPSATANTGFWVTADNVRGDQFGLLVYTDQGPAGSPFLGGTLCLATVHRTVIVQDAIGTPGLCNGQLVVDWNAYARGLLGGTAPLPSLSVPGTTAHVQFWGRDPGNSFGALLTGSVRFTICP